MKIKATNLLGLRIGLLSFALLVPLTFAQNADSDDEPIVGTADLSESEAREFADDIYTGDGEYTDIELEMEDGVLVYAVEYTEDDGNEVDVKLNADTGTILKIESDETEDVNDDDGDTEDDDEDAETITQMKTIISLLTQLLALLQAKQMSM